MEPKTTNTNGKPSPKTSTMMIVNDIPEVGGAPYPKLADLDTIEPSDRPERHHQYLPDDVFTRIEFVPGNAERHIYQWHGAVFFEHFVPDDQIGYAGFNDFGCGIYGFRIFSQ